MTDKLELGDICITINSLVPELNDGLLVEILEIDPGKNEGRTPYLVRRLDGEPFPASRDFDGRNTEFFASWLVWAKAYNLRKIRPDGEESGLARREVREGEWA